MTDRPTVETIKLVHPHYTDDQALIYLAMHDALAEARDLIARYPVARPLLKTLDDVTRVLVQTASR